MYVFVHAHALYLFCVRIYMHRNIRTYIHTNIHTYVRTYIHACVRTYVRTCVHAYIRTCILCYIQMMCPCRNCFKAHPKQLRSPTGPQAFRDIAGSPLQTWLSGGSRLGGAAALGSSYGLAAMVKAPSRGFHKSFKGFQKDEAAVFFVGKRHVCEGTSSSSLRAALGLIQYLCSHRLTEAHILTVSGLLGPVCPR